MRIKSFITKVMQDDPTLATVKLSLTKEKNKKKFLDALQDPKNLGCKNISELDLSGSRFTKDELVSLIQALNNLPNITTLRLDGCKIYDSNTVGWDKLKHIKILSLKDNSLVYSHFRGSLTALYLDDNPALHVKTVLTRFTSEPNDLQILSLNNCNVDNETLTHLMSGDSKLKQLRQLYLRGNLLKLGCMDALRGFNSLTVLDIGDNFQIEELGDELPNECPILEELYADHCGLYPRTFNTIANMATLHTVDLSRNTRLLRDNSLQGLGLGDDEANFKNIRTIKLNGCKLTDQFIPELAQFFPNLVNLSLAQNRLTQFGVENLLRTFKQLQALDVSTQELYKIPAPQQRPLSPRQEEDLRKRQAPLESLLRLICETPELVDINLGGTGLTSEMLLSLVPTPADGRKLAIINGLSCIELEKQERDKLAFKATEASPSQKPEVVIEEISSPRAPSRKGEIQRLKARIKQLEQELQEVKAENTVLKGKAKAAEPTSGSVGDRVALFEAMSTSAKEKRTQVEGVHLHGHFSRSAKKRGAQLQTQVVASSSVQQDGPSV